MRSARGPPGGGLRMQKSSLTRSPGFLLERSSRPGMKKLRGCSACSSSALPRYQSRPSERPATRQVWTGKLVAGPGFEPAASRSRITRQFIQTCRFLRFSVRFFKSTRPERPDLRESSAELLHELLHGLSTEVDGATLCAPAFRCRNLCALWARHLKFSMFLAMQGSLRYSIAGADRWPCHTASQGSHRVLRAGDAQGVAALWRRGDPDVACQGRARSQ